MAYASRLDLENTFGEDEIQTLADNNNDMNEDSDVVSDALNFASEVINAHLARRYTVPLDPTPNIVRKLCIDITWYRLAHDPLKQTVEHRQRYEDAIDLLKRIADGKASLGQDTDGDGVSDDQSIRSVAKVQFMTRA